MAFESVKLPVPLLVRLAVPVIALPLMEYGRELLVTSTETGVTLDGVMVTFALPTAVSSNRTG